jgi:hypothetical protein
MNECGLKKEGTGIEKPKNEAVAVPTLKTYLDVLFIPLLTFLQITFHPCPDFSRNERPERWIHAARNAQSRTCMFESQFFPLGETRDIAWTQGRPVLAA